ncbi:HAD family hydrolase [Mesorhizobium sp. WSM2239]|uniref:HAD family hydrolase n=2 Tax=unclassified Mesorhizobium TaxID=325217 RepID=A0AAU8DIB4_9HYPH
MIEGAREERRVTFVDADNTLWDTDGVFAAAQLKLLTAVEGAIGLLATSTDRLTFVRSVDQALADRHHLGLRYPPRLLAIGIALALRGEEPGVAARRVWAGGLTSSGLELALAQQIELEFIQWSGQLPDLLPGVREGLQRLHEGGVLIVVVTEGARSRVTRTADEHGLTALLDKIVEAPKSERLFQRVQKLGRARAPAFMIGDQLRRDIEPAKAAGLLTIYVPGRFRPRWEPDETSVRPDYRVERFDQGADIVLAGG